jgi:phosphohistidine phosphatase
MLVRHAKSSWDDLSLPDRDRPFSDRGERDLVTMGERLARRGAKADLILTSPAVRARATAQGMAAALGCKHKDIVVDERLNGCRATDLLGVVQGLDGGLRRAMLVGHDPALSELARQLASEITHLPTCAVAEFRFEAKSWSAVGRVPLQQVALDCPKHAR